MQTVGRIAGLTICALIAAGGVMQAGAATLAQFSLDSLSSGNTVATDISSNSHDATFNRVVTLTTDNPFDAAPSNGFGMQGKSVSLVNWGANNFDWQVAFLAHPETLDLNHGGRNQFTLEGWIKPWVTNQYMTLIELSDSASSVSFFLGLLNDGRPIASLHTSGGTISAIADRAAPTNRWTHLAMVYNVNSDGTIHLYVNGTNVNSVYSGAGVASSYNLAYFGGAGSLGQVYGLVDDIRISDEALAPGQLGFNGSFTRSATLAKFDLDSLSSGNTVATDISSNSHDATFSEAVTLSNDNPFHASPNIGYAVQGKSASLTGATAIAYLANPGTIDINNGGLNQFTLEAWFKPAAYGTAAAILRMSNPSLSSWFGISILADGRAEAFFNSWGHGWSTIDSATSLPLNAWSHIAAVYNANNDARLRLYVNGVEAGDSVYQGIDVPGSYTEVYFGQQPGLIDDVRISQAGLAPSFLGYHKSFTVRLKVITPGALIKFF